MTLTKEKIILPEYEEFSNSFIEDKEINFEDFKSIIDKPVVNKYYANNSIPDNYTLIINRLDEIENLINTKVAHKTDIKKSKDEIILEQKSQIQDLKDYIKRILIVLDKKSTPKLFSAISLVALLISALFFLVTIIFGELILTKIHLLFSTIGFILMFVMAHLSQKIHYGKNT